MKKAYALTKLLEHGPMQRDEILECTGWTYKQVERAIGDCTKSGLVRRIRKNGFAKWFYATIGFEFVNA